MTEDIQALVGAINDLRTEVTQLREMMTMLIDLVVQVESDDGADIERLPGLMPTEWIPDRGFGM